MQLHLIRHGETGWNAEGRVQGHADNPLNEVGREQARALRERLAHLRPARIYASSSRRTRETAELAFGHLDLDLIVSDQLREIGLGDWEGQLYQDLEHRHPEAVRLFRQEPHNFRYPGAETFAELQARGLAALADIVAREEPGSDILVVSHGAMIRALLSHYLERPLSRLWEPPRMHNCAHSIIEFPRHGSPRVLRYADLHAGF